MLDNSIFSNSFVNLGLMGIITLFPVINPVRSAFLISLYLENLSQNQKKNVFRKITLYVFCFCVGVLFIEPFILRNYSIIGLDGGIMIYKIGWEFLYSKRQESDTTLKENAVYSNITDRLFYPITFPVMAGAGAILALFT